MSEGADVVVIGAGISGLVDAILLAETGRRVVVVEQHTIPGGYLQTFTRRKTVFDVGFHYLGSTAPGRPMRQFLEHLQVWDRITLRPFPADAAIEVVSGGRRWAYPARFEDFVSKALATWPDQAEGLERFAAEVNSVCRGFAWFDLKREADYVHPLDLPFFRGPLSERLPDLGLTDPWLLEVLGMQSFNLGLFPHEIPWTKHALAFRSNFDTTSRIDGGGGALVAALVARGQELGVEYRFRTEVTGFQCRDRSVHTITTTRGDLSADLFVAACHPKPILRRIDDADLKPMFKERIFDLRDSRGALQLFLRLKQPLTSLNETCVLLRDPAQATHPELPLDTILITQPPLEATARGGPRLEAMTYLYEAPFQAWKGTPVMKRGPDYDAFKARLAQRVVDMITTLAPELPDLIVDQYAATPLSDAWYTLNEGGSVFGISHDITQQGRDRPQPRTRLKNLWFSGHSIQMPGICGVFINAFHTCSALRGDDLFEQVAT